RSALNLIPLFPRTGRRGVIKAAVIMTWPLDVAPKQVSITWGTFPLDVDQSAFGEEIYREIQAQVVASGTSEVVRFLPNEPQYIWHAPADDVASNLLVDVPEPPEPTTVEWPVASIAIVGAWLVVSVVGLVAVPAAYRQRTAIALTAALPATAIVAVLVAPMVVVETKSPFASAQRMPTEDEAVAIFQPLQTNIYRAFDYVDESDVYDALAQSVDGPLLDDLYNQIYRSLIMQDQGGAVSRVEQVTPMDTEVLSIGTLPPDDQIGFTVRSRWQVEGAVYHWGHSHRRTNEYLAEYAVIDADGGWRISGNRVLEQKRVAAYDGGGPMGDLAPADPPGAEFAPPPSPGGSDSGAGSDNEGPGWSDDEI
ncbi:MAG: hypothetical protein ACOC0P_05400, partial [Planctomycetota bacterium]